MAWNFIVLVLHLRVRQGLNEWFSASLWPTSSSQAQDGCREDDGRWWCRRVRSGVWVSPTGTTRAKFGTALLGLSVMCGTVLLKACSADLIGTSMDLTIRWAALTMRGREIVAVTACGTTQRMVRVSQSCSWQLPTDKVLSRREAGQFYLFAHAFEQVWERSTITH